MKLVEAAGGRPAAESASGEATEARPILDDYLKKTAYLGWREATSAPLDTESVIAVFEDDGAVRFARTRYVRADGGWTDRSLRNRRFFWVHDPPV
jgi:hypothetical protein